MARRNTRIALLLILLLAAALRLVGLNNTSPPGITHDEVANWLIDRSILAGNHAIYFTQAYGHEAGYHYLQAGFVALLGDNVLALRLPSAFLGLLLVAVTYALVRRLFGRDAGVLAAGVTAVLLWPVFFSRLALRAISLPVLSGLSTILWWQAWEHKDASAPLLFTAAGLIAGLSFHTYMAARAVPIFYGAWLIYLALFHRRELRARWRGVALFWLAYALVAAPLAWYLLTNPGAEFRVSEVDAPLRALLTGDLRPILANSWAILRGFITQGDPLWRQNVAERAVFDPLLALLFYAGLGLFLRRWRTPRYGFVLLWLATSALPSLVTINAPSSIRMINGLPLLTVPLAVVFVQLMHKARTFSTESRQFSTTLALTVGLVVWGGLVGWGTAVAIFQTWPNNEEVQFVWQAAFTDMGVYLDAQSNVNGAAIAGWTPDTMDAPTMELLLQREDARLSHFSPLDGTLVLPGSGGPILRPAILELDGYWEGQLAAWGAEVVEYGRFVQYTLPQSPIITLDVAQTAIFGGELRLLGFDRLPGGLVTSWEVVAVPENGRRLFVQLLDAAGNVLAEDYHWDTADPQNLWQPRWQVGDRILQRHTLPKLGRVAQVRLGVFDPYTCDPGPCQNLPLKVARHFLLPFPLTNPP